MFAFFVSCLLACLDIVGVDVGFRCVVLCYVC